MATGTMKWATGMMTVAALGGISFFLTQCDQPAKAGTPSKVEDVTIDGKKFHLELALDDTTRFHGLSDRTAIADDGGMLFVFPRAVTTSFVMRDCPIPIDIIYLDATGRVLNTYKMTAEPPRADDEKALDPQTKVNKKYEDRLKRYPSEFDSQFVIELRGNTLDTIKVKKNDKITLDLVGLKKRAK